MSVITDLLVQPSAEISGTPRAQFVASQDLTETTGPAITSVIDAMLSAGEARATELLAGTPAGQRIQSAVIANQAQAYWMQYGPLLLIALLGVILFMVLRR